MTRADVFVAGEPPADVHAPSVLQALLRAGRWDDAASYCQTLSEVPLVERASLLLAAGRADEAHRLLANEPAAADDPTPHLRFLQRVDTLMHGNLQLFPELITESDRLPGHVLVALVMLRAAAIAGRPDVEAHYARQVLQVNPADPDAARAVALHLIDRGEYVDAIHVLDRAEAARCDDERSAVEEAVDRLRTDQARVNALVTIGRHLHREKDPTLPVTDAAQAAGQRWRSAYRDFGAPYWTRRLAWLATAAVTLGSFFLIGTALPGLAIGVGVGAWLRSRPLPGLDLRTSQIVRAVSDPRTVVLARRYRAFDVFTFIFTAVVAGGVAAQLLPGGPAWLGATATGAVLIIAAATTRARRRWLRHQRQRLLRPPYEPRICTCLDIAVMQGPDSRDYLDQHLFRAGAVPNQPGWHVLQCLATHTRFLALPSAQLAIRIAAGPSEETAA